MGNRKVALIGGGGVRTPLVIYGVNESSRHLGVDEMVLYDLDLERAQLIAPAPDQKFGQQFGRGAMPVPPQPRQFEARLPFESQLDDAMQREPVVPVVRTAEPVVEVKAPAFAASAEKPVPAKKSRFFFRNLLLAGLSILASRLLR